MIFRRILLSVLEGGLMLAAGGTSWVLTCEPLAARAAWQSAEQESDARIAAGRSYLRLNLAATELSVAMHPFSRGLQEYPEMQPGYAELEAALAPQAGSRVQMFARLGFAASPPGSPRWPFSSRFFEGGV